MSASLTSSDTNSTNNNVSTHGNTNGSNGHENMTVHKMAEAIMRMRNSSSESDMKDSDLIMSKDKPKQVLTERLSYGLLIDDFNRSEYGAI